MAPDKTKNQIIVVTIDNEHKIEFVLHTFFEILEAFIEQRF